MKTCILHGGMTSQSNKQNDYFWGQIPANVNKQDVKILMCYWSRTNDRWEEKYQHDMGMIQKNTSKSVEFHLLEDVKDLKSKIDKFDGLYVAGGEPELIQPYYPKLSFLKKKLEGKVYAGSSMGAFMASENYVVSRERENGSQKGIGLVPINVLCHWDVEPKKEHKISILTKTSDLPILTLDECQTATILV